VPRAAEPTRSVLSRRFSPASPISPSKPASPHRPVLSLSWWLLGLLVSSACVVVVDDGTGALGAVALATPALVGISQRMQT
jgi:hypothetical protein